MPVTKVALVIDAGLTNLGHGSAVDLAAAMGVGHSTVGSWRSGARLPRPQRWSEIETFLMLEPGTIAAAVAQDYDR